MAHDGVPDPRLVLLGGLTLVSGFVDAVSYLRQGHVFVANMTGNIVFLGFAIAGAPDISIPGSLVALAAFLLGALSGGRLSRRHGDAHARLLVWTTAAKIVLIAAAAACASIVGADGSTRFAIVALLGVSMGLQNAIVRSLGVPDMTTTVLTQMLTGLVADSTLAGDANPRFGRRLASVLLMFAGALIGGVLVLRLGFAPALAAPAAILLIVSAAAWRIARA